MAVKLFLSETRHALSERIIEEIKKNRESAGHHVVIVPDRFTLSAEKDVLKGLGIHGAFDISVTSFKRLATFVLDKKSQNTLTPEGAVMLLSKVIIENRENLVFYKNASFYSGFATEFYAVLTSIRNNCYTIQDLISALPSLPEYVRQKTKDIILILDEYLKKLSDTALDGSTLLSSLARECPESDYICNSDFYVFDFFSFTAEQRRVLGAIGKSAKSLSIALLKGDGLKNGRIFPSKEYQRLKNTAKDEKFKVSEEYVSTNLDSGRRRVLSEMFSYDTSEKTSGGKGIEIFEAESAEGEIAHLARKIKKLVKEGYRYRDISVLAGDIDGNRERIKRIFLSHDIPFFADEKTKLLKTPLFRYIKSVIKAGIKKTDIEMAQELISNPFSGIKKSEGADFLSYATKYSINYLPKSEFVLGKSAVYYENAEKVREKVLALYCDLEKTDTAENHVKRLENFLKNQEIDRKTQEITQKQRKIGDEYSASCTEQSLSKIQKILNEMKEILRDTEIKKEEFLGILTSAVESVEIAYIPMFSDVVYVGGIDESRFTECKVLCVLNAKSGTLPKESERIGIFGEAEEKALLNAGIDLSPTVLEQVLEEKLHLLQLCIMPKEKLFISFTQTDGEKRSDMVEDYLNLFSDIDFETEREFYGDKAEDGHKFLRAIEYLTQDRKTLEYAYSFGDFGKKIKAVLQELLGNTKKQKREVQNVNGAKESFFANGRTSISQLENYFRCPYSHYFNRGLYIKPVETATSVTLIGSFLHYVLEIGLKELKNADFPVENSEKFEEISQKTLKFALQNPDFEPLLSKKFKTLKLRLLDEGGKMLRYVSSFARESEYKPKEFEFSFGYGKQKFFLKGEKATLSLGGKIDRMDTLGDKAVLLDYKTGRAPGDMQGVYYGTGVQLFMYMSVLDELGVKTVGAFYFPISNEYVKKEEIKPRLKGNVLGSEFSSFEPSQKEFREKSLFVDADFRANGAPLTNAKTTLCTDTELQALKDYSVKVCEKAIDEMADGYIAPTPLDDACKYCAYKALCAGLKTFAREKKNVNKSDIVDLMENKTEERKNG